MPVDDLLGLLPHWLSLRQGGDPADRSAAAGRVQRRPVRQRATGIVRAGDGSAGSDQCKVGVGDASPGEGAGFPGMGYASGAIEPEIYDRLEWVMDDQLQVNHLITTEGYFA